jgi:protein N-terminal glutamine amidohydrolase
MQKFEKSSFLYTSLFCEENIWHLTNSLISQGISENTLNILFITNSNNKIAFFNQQATAHNQAVIWDYHVILLAKIERTYHILDFDTRLPFPDDFDHYLQHSLPDKIHDEYSSQFRLIPAKVYLSHFNSDRSHMKNVIPDTLFPTYPAIQSNNRNKIKLTDLFNHNKTISNTLIIQDKNQLVSWVTKQ